METITTISNAFSSGGIWMWAILAVQIVSFAIIAERIFKLYVLRKTSQKKLAHAFESSIKKGDLAKTLDKSKRAGFLNPIGAITRAGTQAALDLGGKEEIQARMDEVILHETSKLEERTPFLAMLGNVGTLLGLLGTIVGLIKSFASVSGADPVTKAAMLTEGISMAMNTTAYGLIMAIPALIMYAVLTNRTQKLVDDMNQASLKVYNWLSFTYESAPKRSSRKSSL